MARKSKGQQSHKFRNKLILNQWLISLFGIDPLVETTIEGKAIRPFHILKSSLKDPSLEGIGRDSLHRFYHALVESNLFLHDGCCLSKAQLLAYEENIARHTQAINDYRNRSIVWKYYQWLTLLFVEIYLDRYFSDLEGLVRDLNDYVERFNSHWPDFKDVPLYTEDDLNKLCVQSATGSGKTLLMHVNILQYLQYAKKHCKDKELSRVILLTPNERLSEQHIAEFKESRIEALNFAKEGHNLFTQERELERVDVLEITKLADQDGPNTIATRSLGDQNLLLVDEGHRGMSGKDEGVWFTRRSELCAKGFTFEYSATFEQAVQASKSDTFENSYSKAVIFDYSYRWFYEDGFGKDYQILNLPKAFDESRSLYLTACLLKFYQQLRIYDEKKKDIEPFNIEKPLWVFVGSTVSSAKGTSDEIIVATDVAQIIQFIASFLENKLISCRRIGEILMGKGQDTGLLDKNENDIFEGSFVYLAKTINAGETVESLYLDILSRLFNNPAGGSLYLDRVKGASGEVVLRVGSSETPFGLINVGNAKGLCDHIAEVANQNGIKLTVEDTNFNEAMFNSVKESASPVNLLIGSKKFVEGWDCWRVGTMGLMHVGQSEGSQIIQLYGRGVRLKGYEWSLKRSGHVNVAIPPSFIEELETLNVFGIEADFMEKFRQFLKDEGLPGNERRKTITVPLNVTYDFGKRLRILRPKRKSSDGEEYSFIKDGRVPTIGDVPTYLIENKVIVDGYPRIEAMHSRGVGLVTQKDKIWLSDVQAMLDIDALFFELEQFKRERRWYNLNITKEGICRLLKNSSWYILNLPEARLNPAEYDGVLLLQQVATELLKHYCDHYYNYCERQFIEPRLELRELTNSDENIPQDEYYRLIVDGSEEQVILGIQEIKKDLETKKDALLKIGDINACNFANHLYQPLFHVRSGSKVTVLPVTLKESEYQFVVDLKGWCKKNQTALEKDGMDLFLLRNMSRGKGVGFFETGKFYPDFILWTLVGDKQYITLIEPHGLLHEGPGSDKILFHTRIKDVERRMNDPAIILNSFVLSWTRYPQLKWGKTQQELEDMHVFFPADDPDHYIDKLFAKLWLIKEKTGR
jgi:hypothetical protein